MRARARRKDPSTSKRAAERASAGLSVKQQAVMVIFRMADGPLLDEELHELYKTYQKGLKLPNQGPSGPRSRRSDLVKLGKIIPAGKRKMSTGGSGMTWMLAPDGRQPSDA